MSTARADTRSPAPEPSDGRADSPDSPHARLAQENRSNELGRLRSVGMIRLVTASQVSDDSPTADSRYSPGRIGGGPVELNTRQAWIAADYVGLLASQAGYAWRCVRPDGDVHSLDGDVVVHPGGSVFVQVKGRRPHFAKSSSYSIKQAWRRNWKSLLTPAYFVVVTVPDEVAESWVEHPTTGSDTRLHLSAYWARIDPLEDSTKSVQVVRSSRLTVETFDQWRMDYIDSTRLGFGLTNGASASAGGSAGNA